MKQMHPLGTIVKVWSCNKDVQNAFGDDAWGITVHDPVSNGHGRKHYIHVAMFRRQRNKNIEDKDLGRYFDRYHNGNNAGWYVEPGEFKAVPVDELAKWRLLNG
jgi:hypothetical protein